LNEDFGGICQGYCSSNGYNNTGFSY